MPKSCPTYYLLTNQSKLKYFIVIKTYPNCISSHSCNKRSMLVAHAISLYNITMYHSNKVGPKGHKVGLLSPPMRWKNNT